jgi:hypothetical protein
MRSLIQIHIIFFFKLQNIWVTSIFDPNSNVAKHLSYLKYFVVPEDKVGNYIVFVNKPHYIKKEHMHVQWNLCNPTSEFSNIHCHPTKNYTTKVFLLTKIPTSCTIRHTWCIRLDRFQCTAVFTAKLIVQYEILTCNMTIYHKKTNCMVL